MLAGCGGGGTSKTAVILPNIPLAGAVAVSPTSTNIPFDFSQTFTATVVDDFGNKGVTWTLQGKSTTDFPACQGTSCGTLSAKSPLSVTYTTPSSLASHSPKVQLVATSAADPTKSGVGAITVIAPTSISVSVSPSSATVIPGETLDLFSTVKNDGNSAGVTWSINGDWCPWDEGCGAISATKTASGASTTYTAPSGVFSAPFNITTITATSVSDVSKSASVKITF
jgi:hypothetical protein